MVFVFSLKDISVKNWKLIIIIHFRIKTGTTAVIQLVQYCIEIWKKIKP